MMKFVTLALVAALTSGIYVSAAELDLSKLGFVLYGKHGDGAATTVTSGKCPLGELPDTVFLHKTFKKGDNFFTWVRPVHAKVTKVVSKDHLVWEGAADEFLLDLHFVGSKNSKKFVHLELLHRLGGAVHVFLAFAAGANPGAGKVVGMAAFVAALHELVPGLHEVEGLPAHHLVHALKLHAAA
ncbi:hypothetical protein TpMuguga_02g00327 [Theileria parva strain Muguga]|uniref:Uncharacterized protein n=1 Tax=Theileria parva TaxID=5875 RepID=Q4N5G3_THEPA|nr:uncharacterized protein TpMuguga_02g00327 [Theileria parva strain Muguga]EAN32610.1 hypothetical protein TpMuguga_02g00327 [Theileria parva strain Muguga]|eukprot:XP_764893.1 hypothetical protein [Theileria parva strain Muguga]